MTVTKSKGLVQFHQPFTVDVKMGNTYLWCSCGKSRRPPFCDGAHAMSDFKPIRLVARDFATVRFCGCKQTNTPPFCDGSHAMISD